jgi:hypothetical protein
LQLCLGSLIGFGAIYFGYRLFSQIPVTVTNDGHFKMPKIGEAKLKVAPGIFFAIVGCVIIYFSINRSIEIQADDRAINEPADFASAPKEGVLPRARTFKYACLPPSQRVGAAEH